MHQVRSCGHTFVISLCTARVYLFTAVEVSNGGNEEFYDLGTQAGQLGGAPQFLQARQNSLGDRRK